MVGQHYEAAVEQALLADEDRFHDCLQVVVDHAQWHAAAEGKRPVMRVEHHLLRLSRVGHDEHLAAERQAKIHDLDSLHDSAELDMFISPIERADLARRKSQ